MIKQFFLIHTRTSTTNLGQSGPGNNGNKGVLHIPQSSWAGTSPKYSLVLYQGHSLRLGFTSIQRCKWSILQPYPTRQRILLAIIYHKERNYDKHMSIIDN